MHYVHALHDVRRDRVLTRHVEKGNTFSLEVTPMMFNFMEMQFDFPLGTELSGSIAVNTPVAA